MYVLLYKCPCTYDVPVSQNEEAKSEVDRILKAPSHPLFQVFLEPHIA